MVVVVVKGRCSLEAGLQTAGGHVQSGKYKFIFCALKCVVLRGSATVVGVRGSTAN